MYILGAVRTGTGTSLNQLDEMHRSLCQSSSQSMLQICGMLQTYCTGSELLKLHRLAADKLSTDRVNNGIFLENFFKRLTT
jgi:hypothetical protein